MYGLSSGVSGWLSTWWDYHPVINAECCYSLLTLAKFNFVLLLTSQKLLNKGYTNVKGDLVLACHVVKRKHKNKLHDKLIYY